MSLLGSLILDPRVMAEVLSIVAKPEDFYLEKHGAIFAALLQVFDRHQAGDLVEIHEVLRDTGMLEEVGGADYLLRLAECVPSAVTAPHYARIVAEKARLRRLIDAAAQILYDAHHHGQLGPEGAREVLDRAETAVFNIAQEDQKSDPQHLAELMELEWNRLIAQEGRGVTGIATHFTDLDKMLSGLQPGEMIVLAARPSMGKTALALNMAEQIALGRAFRGPRAQEGVPVGVFSLEMTKSAVVQRLISGQSGVNAQILRSGMLSRRHQEDIEAAISELREAHVYVDDSPSLTALALRARARRMVAQYAVRVIIVDYLQLLTSPGAGRESRQVEVSAISRQLKALARDLSIPIVCLSQLNRASEQREGHRPRMADLRESGSIEQDADVVMLLHREDYFHVGDVQWEADNPDKIGVAELIVAKQRNGPTGTVKLVWDNDITRFKNYDGRSGGGGYANAPSGGRSGPPSNYGAAARPSSSPAPRPASPPPSYQESIPDDDEEPPF